MTVATYVAFFYGPATDKESKNGTVWSGLMGLFYNENTQNTGPYQTFDWKQGSSVLCIIIDSWTAIVIHINHGVWV